MAVFVGDPILVREDVRVTIDCGRLINNSIANGLDPNVTWFKDGVPITNGSEVNVVISADRRFCIITDTLKAVGGQLGNDSFYSCEVCKLDTDNCRVSNTPPSCGE